LILLFFPQNKTGSRKNREPEKRLAGRAIAADAVMIPAAAQQQNDPDPGIAIAPAVIAAAIIAAAQPQQNDDPDDTVVVTTAKSTHNKNTSLR